jgi:hypothetical protein
MSILNFDDGKNSKKHPNKASQQKRFKAILGVGAIVLSVSLGSTLAANINLNSGTPVEFGQGVATTTACDNSISITPNSEFVNSADNPGFAFTSFTVSDISDACDGKLFTIRAYKNGQNDPLNLYNVNAGDSFDKVEVLRSQGNYSSVGEGSFPEGITSSAVETFTVTFATSVDGLTTVPVALAEDVDRMTIESRDLTNIASASESFVRVQDTSEAGTLTSSDDVDGSTSVVNDGTGYVNVLVKNGFGETLATPGVLSATATNGAAIEWNSSPADFSTSVLTGVSGVLYVKQGSANANASVTTTITVSFNGTVLASKTIAFAGQDSDGGGGGPETRNVYWDDDCPPVYCVPSSGGQQTFIEGEQVTDYASDPSASGYSFTGWTSVTDSGGDLTFTANWMQDFSGGGGGGGGDDCISFC